jgi:hypothetical protein
LYGSVNYVVHTVDEKLQHETGLQQSRPADTPLVGQRGSGRVLCWYHVTGLFISLSACFTSIQCVLFRSMPHPCIKDLYC